MVSLYPILAGPSRPYLIEGSLSTALDMGGSSTSTRAVLPMRSPTPTAAGCCSPRLDVERRSDAGFTKGNLVLEGQLDFDGKGMDLSFQNEFLAGWVGRSGRDHPGPDHAARREHGGPVTTMVYAVRHVLDLVVTRSGAVMRPSVWSVPATSGSMPTITSLTSWQKNERKDLRSNKTNTARVMSR